MDNKTYNSNVKLTFSNDNNAISDFFQAYNDLCLDLANGFELHYVEQKISAFMYWYDYAIPTVADKKYYRKQLAEVSDKIIADKRLQELIGRKDKPFVEELAYYRLYYTYLLMYLEIVSDYSEKLSATFMPNTNLQKKYVIYSNNQHFFDKFSEHSRSVALAISDFSLTKFRASFDRILTYYYAYRLFVTNKHKFDVERCLNLVLSVYLNEEVIYFLNKYAPNDPNCYNINQWKDYKDLNNKLGLFLSLSVSSMNASFSTFGVLPKVNEEIHVDKTLI